MMIPKIKPWRSEKHRKMVATIPRFICGARAVQVCHANASKGMGTKASDALTWPMYPTHHREHDTGGMPRADRWRLEWEYCDKTRSILIRRNQWSAAAEAAYQIAIVPLARVVHGEATDA